jgi:hypothetical protein
MLVFFRVPPIPLLAPQLLYLSSASFVNQEKQSSAQMRLFKMVGEAKEASMVGDAYNWKNVDALLLRTTVIEAAIPFHLQTQNIRQEKVQQQAQDKQPFVNLLCDSYEIICIILQNMDDTLFHVECVLLNRNARQKGAYE